MQTYIFLRLTNITLCITTNETTWINWGLWCQKQVSQAGIPQYSEGCNCLSLSEIPASGTNVFSYLCFQVANKISKCIKYLRANLIAIIERYLSISIGMWCIRTFGPCASASECNWLRFPISISLISWLYLSREWKYFGSALIRIFRKIFMQLI